MCIHSVLQALCQSVLNRQATKLLIRLNLHIRTHHQCNNWCPMFDHFPCHHIFGTHHQHILHTHTLTTVVIKINQCCSSDDWTSRALVKCFRVERSSLHLSVALLQCFDLQVTITKDLILFFFEVWSNCV